MKKIIIISIAIRLLLMPFFAYPEDIFDNHFSALKIVENWQYLFSIRYSPLSHLIDAFFIFLFKPFLPEKLDIYLAAPPINIPNINRILFLFKLPYLLAEYLGYFALKKLFIRLRISQQTQKRTFVFLLFNPIILYSVYIFGRFESYVLLASFILFFALYKIQDSISFKDIVLIISSLIMAVFIREFYLLLIFCFLLLKKDVLKRLFILFFVSGAYFLFLFTNVKKGIITSSYGGLNPFFSAKIPLLGEVNLFLFFLLLGIVFIYSFLKISFKSKSNLFIFNWFSFLILACFFISSYFHPQYFVWILPFMTVNLIYIRNQAVFKKILIIYWIISFLFLFIPLRSSIMTFAVMFPLSLTFTSISLDRIISVNYQQYVDAGKSFLSGSLVALVFYLISYFSNDDKINKSS